MMRPHRIEGLHRGQKIARDQFRALMNQLVEGVLSIGTGLSPDDRASAPTDRFALPVYPFTAALHVPLLEIRGEAVEILIIRKDRVSLCVVEVVVPDSQ